MDHLKRLLAAHTVAAGLVTLACGSGSKATDAAPTGSGGSAAAGASSHAGTSGAKSGGGATSQGPTCTATAKSEVECVDGQDDDCDGFVDCLDPDYDGTGCGDGRSCVAGACLGQGALPELPRLDNLAPIVRGDTAVVSFEPVLGALDYRIYPLPSDDDVLVGGDGSVVVKNAIYRCSGALPRTNRSTNEFKPQFASSLAGDVNGYTRKESESVLGHVFLTPGPGRVPVYRVANPNLRGGYVWEYEAPPAKEYNGADYVATEQERDTLLARGYRDDGIAFYAPSDGAVTVYRREFASSGLVTFYTDGPEKTVRDGQQGEGGPRFHALASAEPGSVPLHRIFYLYHNDHDNLAAGDANKERVLYQGQAPVTAATWPGLTGKTTLVIEALDSGCPFPGGYVGAMSAPATDLGGVPSQPSITLDEARSPTTGEVFINGQFEPKNRPKPIARSYVTVEPQPHPKMDWFQSFDPGASDTAPKAFQQVVSDNIGTQVFRTDQLSLEFEATNANVNFGSMLGQFVIGSSATFTIAALGADARLASKDFLHVTMSVDIAATRRRYPQIVITDTPIGDPNKELPQQVPVMRRLGPLPENGKLNSVGSYHTIVAQPFGGSPELQIEFCDRRGWGVSLQCPKANVYGFPAGTEEKSTSPWLPLPVGGEYVGMDRPAKVDVYASTDRVYLFLEDRPAGCAVLPAGRMPAGSVNVLFGVAGYHIEIDEFVTTEFAPDEYWRRYSIAHTDRKLDDLGIESGVARPAWDETVMPCGESFFGGELGGQ